MSTLHEGILRAASLLAPSERRTEWLREWRSELWYVPREEATSFCAGAFRDALWVRRNEERETRLLDSPWACLVLLAVVAVFSAWLSLHLPRPKVLGMGDHPRIKDFVQGSVAMLVYSAIFLPATRIAMGPAAGRLRARPLGWLFLAAKVALIQPVIWGGVLVVMAIARFAPVAPLGIGATWIVAYRWLVSDQRRRCPVCLRRMTEPVRIGAPSRTFLEWYGAEEMCARGHGMLQTSESPSTREWHALGVSWQL